MTVNNRTSSRDYAKPNVANLLSEDVVRLSEALDSIDTDVAALQSKAPLASPALTGTPSAPTPAVDTNTTQLATTAFVVGQASAANPAINGTAAAGSSLRFARADHVHPIDTSRAPVASPTFTGTPAAPTPATDTNSTRLATTAFVIGQDYTKQTRTFFAGAGLTGGGDLSANRTISADVATQAEAEAGTSSSKLMTPQRVAQAIVASGPLAGFRNRIINGGLAIDQRNGGASQTITTAGAFTADRWVVLPTDSSVTGQRINGATAGQYRYQVTGASGNTSITCLTRIEADNTASLNSTTVTLGVDLANTLLTTVSWQLFYATARDNFAGVTSIASGSWTVSGTVARYTAQISIPFAATTGLQLNLYTGAQTSGTFTFGNVQLEPGPVATPFEQRPIGTELALCQRYFQSYPGIFRADGNASGPGASVTGISFPFSVPMRVAPSSTGSYTTNININTGPFITTNAEGLNITGNATAAGQTTMIVGPTTFSAEL